MTDRPTDDLPTRAQFMGHTNAPRTTSAPTFQRQYGDRPTDDDAAHARCVEAAARFVEEHDPESPLFARDLRAAAARIRELEALGNTLFFWVDRYYSGENPDVDAALDGWDKATVNR